MEGIDNSKLKELMEDFSKGADESNQEELFDELSKTTLFLPVSLDFEGLDLNDLKKGFEDGIPITIMPFLSKRDDGKIILPLFTDIGGDEKIGHPTFIPVRTVEVVAILMDNKDISGVAINPNDECGLGITTKSFLDFVYSTKIKEISDLIVENSRPLKHESRFYLREEVPLMKKEAVNGIFTSELPFNASFKDNFDEKSKYLNILIFPKGVRFFHIGDMEEFGDSIFPPTLKLKLVEEDGNTFTWRCIGQDLRQVRRRGFNGIPLMAFIVLLVVVFILIKFYI